MVQTISEDILKVAIAQIGESFGYNASSSHALDVMVDISRRYILHMARLSAALANSNCRTETAIDDVIKAFEFCNISIPELQEFVDQVKLKPLPIKVAPSSVSANRINRSSVPDDLLVVFKNEDAQTGADQTSMEVDATSEEPATTPHLMKDIFMTISESFSDVKPVSASKTRPPSPSSVKAIIKIKPPIPTDSTAIISRPKTLAERKALPPASELTLLDTIKANKEQRAKKKMKEKRDKMKVKLVKESKLKAKKTKERLKKKPNERPKKITAKKIKVKVKARDKPKSKLEIKPKDPTPTPEPIPKSPDIPVVENVEPVVEPPRVQSISTKKSDSTKVKKKRKKDPPKQCIIITETISTGEEVVGEDKEWICPGCGKPDDGSMMVECDKCKEWYHISCTNLDKEPGDDEQWICEICTNREAQCSQAVHPRTTDTADDQDNKSEHGDQNSDQSSQDVKCPVCNLPYDGLLMLQCEDPDCAKWFHGRCVNIAEAPNEEDPWFCKKCVEKQQVYVSALTKRKRRSK